MAFSGPFEDQLAIRGLIEAYADAVFRFDADAWAETWAEDAVWDLMGTRVEGRAAIVALWRQAMSAFDAVAFTAMPGALTITGDRAQGRSYTTETLKPKAGGLRRVNGAYEDSFVKRDGRWLFASRAFRIVIDDAQDVKQ